MKTTCDRHNWDEYHETPIKMFDHSRSSGVDEIMLSVRLSKFADTRRVGPLWKVLKHLME